MLETKVYISKTKLDQSDLPEILLKLSETGWKPALMESQRLFLQLAGVDDKVSVPPMRFGRRFSGESYGGDVFFKEGDMYYLVTNSHGFDPREFPTFTFEDEGKTEPYIEIGIVSPNNIDLDKKLKDFMIAAEESMKTSLDGRKARHMIFDWQETKPRTPRIDTLTKIQDNETGPNYARASLVPEEIEAAKVLSTKLARDTLIELSQAGFARERDILNRKTKTQDDIRAALQQLFQCGLLNKEYILECKKTSSPLTRLKDPEQLKNTEVKNLICPTCNARFSEENLAAGYSVSDLGRKMSNHSFWMTIWITDLLSRLGVSKESILWNLDEHGEEIDLLVEFLGRMWIFELKDREFGSGDAYPLNFRQVRYKANKVIIVTTEKVSKDAKKVFEDVAKESRRETKSHPVYIEGLDNAEEILQNEIKDISLRYLQERLRTISILAGYDLGKIISIKFGESSWPPSIDEAFEGITIYR